MKLAKLQSYLDTFGIELPSIHTHAFIDFKQLPKSKGLYSIWQGDTCVYVGQGGGGGGIRARFDHHYNKAHAIYETKKGTRNGTSHGAGWVHARENLAWTPDEWTIEYILTNSAVDRTLIEGIMMKVLNPLCNDETFEDRSK
jgi:hypothetical protein